MTPHQLSLSSQDNTGAIRLSGRSRKLPIALWAAVLLVSASPIQSHLVSGSQEKPDYYASPDGKDAACTQAAPCSLATALSNERSPIRPGGTLWLRGGIYRGRFESSLNGTPERPVIVRQAIGERAIIDGGDSNGNAILTVVGTYTWFWGFEIRSSDPVRVSSQAASWPKDIPRGEGVAFDQATGHGVGTKLINLVIHDTRQGVSIWKQAENSEISGCIIFNNGWDGPPGDRAHGHGIYVQNRNGTTRIVNNIIFNQFSHGIHAYGSASAPLDNLYFKGNILFDSGLPSAFGSERNVLIGGGSVAKNVTFIDNYTYGGETKFGYSAPVEGLTIKDNYFPTTVELNAKDVAMDGNTFIAARIKGFSKESYGGNKYVAARPAGVRSLILRNEYEPGRATAVIYNWDRKRAVPVDLSLVLRRGDPYTIRDVQNYLGAPIVTGIYSGRPVTINLAVLRRVTQPIGLARKIALHSNVEFNVFVVTSEHSTQ